MKKKLKRLRDDGIHHPWVKIMIAMKLSVILVLLIFTQAFASKSYSQKTLLNLKMRNVTVKEVLREIEDNSEFYFLYNGDLVDVDRIVSINVNNKKVDEVLNILFSDDNVNFIIKDRQIVLSPLPYAENKVGMEQAYLKISGKVTDPSGSPLPGVTVIIKETTNGTVTNANGEYSLTNVPGNATLQFSFVGMKTQEIQVEGKISIDVTMEEDAIGIEEVVAVGYGTMKKSDLTGSVASVRSDDIQTVKITSPDQALSGRIAGVQVTQQSSAPGGGVSIRIRGGNSVNGDNEPLYVIDGFPVTSNNSTRSVGSAGNVAPNALSSINPNDIESIEVLKDASATAIYGARGANGVILITTKKGSSGEPRISFDSYYGVQSVSKKIDLCNAEQFAIYVNEYAEQNGISEYFDDPSSLGEGTDWQDEIYTTAPIQNYQLGVSGGSGKSIYYISGNYFDQEGIIENSGYKRYSIRTNVESEIGSRIKVGINFTGSRSINNQMLTAEGNGGAYGAVRSALYFHPYLDVYHEDGSYVTIDDAYDVVGYSWYIDNPVAVVNEYKNELTINRFLTNVFGQINLAKGLTFKTSLGADVDNQLSEVYQSSELLAARDYDGIATTQNREYYSYLSENTLTYSKDITGGHQINALFGYTRQKENIKTQYMYNSNFLDDELENNGIGNGTRSGGPVVSAGESQWQLASWLGRVNYKYRDKYMLTMSARYDGSSRLGKNNRWGFFPSGALAWNMHNEDFMKNIEPVQYLKLRVSYGLTGNTNIGSYTSISGLSTLSYSFNDTQVLGYYLGSLPNADLKWESTAQFDAGFDIGLFDGRLTFTADYYEKNTDDLLLNVTIPSDTGYSSVLKNTGKVRNHGVELALGATVLRSPLIWETQINWSMNRNKLVDLGESESYLEGTTGNSLTIVEEGQPLPTFYGYKTAGIFKNQAEIDEYGIQPDAEPGDVKFVDFDKSGEIDSDDRTYIGNPYPDFIFGWNNTFKYKAFSLTAFIAGVVGNDIYNFSEARMMSSSAIWTNHSVYQFKNRWTSEHTDASLPRAGSSSLNTGNTDLSIEDGSYIRLKTLQLSYELPLKNSALIRKALVYISGQNLFTITNYRGYNPEVNSYGQNNLIQGVDMGAYPLAKTYLLGVKIEF